MIPRDSAEALGRKGNFTFGSGGLNTPSRSWRGASRLIAPSKFEGLGHELHLS